MKTIKRIWENLKWLFNHPPINYTVVQNPKPCTYCNKIPTVGGTVYGTPTLMVLCHECLKKAMDKVLLEGENEKV